MTYKIVLKTSHKHKDRLVNCLNTWLTGLDYVAITDKPTGLANELSMSVSDSYESNEEKTINFINYVQANYEKFDVDWLVFIDDDAILNIPLLQQYLPNMDKNCVYGKNMKGVFKKDPQLEYTSGGCGYFISPELIMRSTPATKCGYGFEDACMGEWIRANNITIREDLPLNGWFPWQHHFETLWTEGDEYVKEMIAEFTEKDVQFLRNHVTHHYIRHKSLMKYIHGVINS